LEAHADWLVGPVTIGQVAVGCMVGWLDFRYPQLDWHTSHPSLARWYVDFALRPAMVATEFKDG
ncbi:MAG: glutathione S-transferase C-terminal domain-containing protein, partial [Gammaproteobacteria bacterium]